MAVSITVDHKLIISHVLHKICLHIQGSKHRTYLQDKDDSLAKHWLESSKVHLPVTWSSMMNQDFQEHSWVAKYWPPEVQDLSRCCWLSQVPPLPGAQWKPGAHSHVLWCPHPQEMLWTSAPDVTPDHVQSILSSPTIICLLYQVLARNSEK
jgi:hypothetical protein